MEQTHRFRGLGVAMVTPFAHGSVDWPAVERLVDYLIEGGADGIVPLGTTGEGPTVTAEERRRLIGTVVEQVGRRAYVLPGTGGNNTEHVIAQTREAGELGADGALVVTPYYNKPTQGGLLAHYRAVADSVDLPVVLYNVPGRTSVSLEPGTIKELARHPRIVGIKEACGSLDQVTEIARDTDLTVLSGDDTLTLPILSVGGRGVISVLGNVVPAAVVRMIRAAEENDLATARSFHQATFPLGRALFLETNPAPVKRALARLGLVRDEVRLPLVRVTEATARRLDEVLASLPATILPTRPVSA